MQKSDLIKYLDSYLQHDQFLTDSSKNGLQVDTTKDTITKIGYAVDATSYLIDQAIEAEVDILLTHHGLYRGYDQPLTGIMYERVKKLLNHDIALYSSHLPLDAHPEVGNNIGLIHAWKKIFALGDKVSIEPFGILEGSTVGYRLESATAIPVAGILTPYAEKMQLVNALYNFGKHDTISSVAIVTGSGGAALPQAHQQNIDLFITGEMVHRQITLAKELGQSILLGGHYETEKIGVKLLCHHLTQRYSDLETIYLDEKY